MRIVRSADYRATYLYILDLDEATALDVQENLLAHGIDVEVTVKMLEDVVKGKNPNFLLWEREVNYTWRSPEPHTNVESLYQCIRMYLQSLIWNSESFLQEKELVNWDDKILD